MTGRIYQNGRKELYEWLVKDLRTRWLTKYMSVADGINFIAVLNESVYEDIAHDVLHSGGRTSRPSMSALLLFSIIYSYLPFLAKTPHFQQDSAGTCHNQLDALEGHSAEHSCLHGRPTLSGFTRTGDILIGGTFPVHFQTIQPKVTFMEEPAQIICSKFSPRYYRWLRTMVFAVDEINKSLALIPNITLGFQIFDTCASLKKALQGTFAMLAEQEELVPNYQCRANSPLVAIVGDSGSTRSIIMAWILGLYRLTQIGYFATSPILSDRNQFPSFFRAVPSDTFQFIGLVHLLKHFGWTWIGILATDNDYGQEAMRTLKQEVIKFGVCVAFSETMTTNRLDRDASRITQVIRSSTASAVVVFLTEVDMVFLLEEMVKQKVTGQTWIASEAWSTSALLSVEKYAKVLVGTIGFAIRSGKIPGLKQFLNSIHPTRDTDDIFVTEFWEETFGCTWTNPKDSLSLTDNRTNVCTGSEKLAEKQSMYNDVDNLRITYGVHNTVKAIVLALQAMHYCRPGKGPFLHSTCSNVLDFQPWQLLHYFKNIHFQTLDSTTVSYDKYGNPPALYDIVNWQLDPEGIIRHVKVGRYDADDKKNLILNESMILWAGIRSMQVPASRCSPSCASGFRQAVMSGEPACCYLCVPCPQGEISNITDSAECFKCPWNQWPNAKQDLCNARSEEFLSSEDPLGATLTGMSICLSILTLCILGLFIHYRSTPIVRANNRSLSYLLLLSLMLCFLCSLAFIGYPTPEKCLLRQAAFGINFAVCISCILAKTIIVVIAFSATKPNNELRRWVSTRLCYIIITACTLLQVLLCVSWLILSPPFQEYNLNSDPGKIIVECNKGSSIAFWCMLGYLGVLASISFIFAFLARKLPDSFNEAQFITFSMLAFLSVWISFIPAYFSTRGKYMVALEVFTILSSTAALLTCIFFPKCYNILLRPEMNTQNSVMGRKIAPQDKDKTS